MKKVLLFFVAALLIVACAKQSNDVEPTNPWSGYQKITKDQGIHPLLAGQFLEVGNVNYYVNWDTNGYAGQGAYFVCTYSLYPGYSLEETHMWCDDIDQETGAYNLPVNKPGAPKIGKFPYKCESYPPNTTFEKYAIWLEELPQYSVGFSISTHAVVSGNGINETAWGFGTECYDKAWGYWDCMTFENNTPVYIVYSVEIDFDTLRVYWMDLTHNESELIYKQPIDPTHVYDGAAFDEVAGKVYFTDITAVTVNEISLNDDSPVTPVGTLTGMTPVSGTFSNGSYYYVDASSLEINEVVINPDGTMGATTTIATIPYAGVMVSDITLTTDGNTIYILATESGVVKLISYVISSDTFSMINVADLTDSAQITMVDNELIAIQETSTGWTKYTVNTTTGDVDDGTVIIDDPGPRGTNITNIRIL